MYKDKYFSENDDKTEMITFKRNVFFTIHDNCIVRISFEIRRKNDEISSFSWMLKCFYQALLNIFREFKVSDNFKQNQLRYKGVVGA